MKKLTNQRGAAIIVALFVVALVAAIATVMMQRFRVDVRRTELTFNFTKANFLAQGALAWAIDQLNNNAAQQQPNKIVDRVPFHFPTQKQDHATIDTTIYDAQGYFNVNDLTETQYQKIFMRLMQILDPSINSTNAQEITLAVVDWVSGNAKNASLDEYYRKLSQPYRSPHRPMASLSELRLVKGVTPDLYIKLSPYIIALPNTTLININSASIPLLMSLCPSLNKSGAKTVYDRSHQTPFDTTEAFTNFDIIKNNPPDPSSTITVLSTYFLVKTNVTVDNQNLTLNSLLERTTQNSKSKIGILWQSKGTL